LLLEYDFVLMQFFYKTKSEHLELQTNVLERIYSEKLGILAQKCCFVEGSRKVIARIQGTGRSNGPSLSGVVMVKHFFVKHW